MLHLVGVQKVRWEGSSTAPAGEYTFFYAKENENHKLPTGFFVHKRIILAFKRVEFFVIGCHTYTKRSLLPYHCSGCSCSNRGKSG
jgi:hypothetical protein